MLMLTISKMNHKRAKYWFTLKKLPSSQKQAYIYTQSWKADNINAIALALKESSKIQILQIHDLMQLSHHFQK
jgi:hypothetical protein